MTLRHPLARTAGTSVAAGVAAVVLAATPAAAHTGRGAGGLWDGLLHPVTGPDHLLAMVAVGVVATLAAGPRRAWLAPAAFVVGMLVGGVAGLADLPLPGAEPLILASVFVLAVAIAGALHGGLGPWLLLPLGIAGLAHGHAHGAEAPDASHPVVYVAGFLVATVALHLSGMGVGTVIRDRGPLRIGVGAATFAAGALLVA
jgi:urease accessory protein